MSALWLQGSKSDMYVYSLVQFQKHFTLKWMSKQNISFMPQIINLRSDVSDTVFLLWSILPE